MKVIVDKKEVCIDGQKTILKLCEEIGKRIPTLCYHKDLSPAGRCKICVVKVNGKITTSCDNFINDGMNIITDDDELRRIRKTNLEVILNNLHTKKIENKSELYSLMNELEINVSSEKLTVGIRKIENPFFSFDSEICLKCGRCVKACHEIQCRFVLNFADRGIHLTLTVGDNLDKFEDAGCEFCGTCVTYCPSSALKNNVSVSKAEHKTTTVCSYCGVGCKIDVVSDGKDIEVVNNGENFLCVKGRYGHSYVLSEERLKLPLVKRYLLEDKPKKFDDEFVEIDWETVLNLTARLLSDTKENYGGDAIGFFTSAKCTNEENYLMQKLARQIYKTNNVDHCARLCHASTVTGLIKSVGSGAMTNSMEDILTNSNTVFIIGANVTEQHPVFGVKIRQAVKNGKIKLIVADPRFTGIAEFSDIFLGINGGADIALINALCKIIIENGLEDKEYILKRCENYEEFKNYISSLDLDELLNKAGISFEKARDCARLIATNRPTAIIWAMGITQHTHGVDNVVALANLQMLTGNVGVKGGGLNPLRGQNNVQGACDMGGLPNVFQGYQSVSNYDVRNKILEYWKFEGEDYLNDKPGLTITEMIDAFGSGDIQALYIMGENPMASDPDLNKVSELLKKGNLLILQDIFFTETAKYADIILPSATLLEKNGTVTNTERKVQLVRKLFHPLHHTKTDLEILKSIALKSMVRQGLKPKGKFSDWNYDDFKDVLFEINETTPIYRGITHKRLSEGEKLHWPVFDKRHKGTEILHVGKFTKGKGTFHVVRHKESFEKTDEDYPFVLNTGRELFHWHGGELTRRVKAILEVSSRPVILINSVDAESMFVKDGDIVLVKSRRGEIKAKAFVTTRIKQKTVFGNFHFPEGNVNRLTIKALDPEAKIPEYKVCAVRVEKF